MERKMIGRAAGNPLADESEVGKEGVSAIEAEREHVIETAIVIVTEGTEKGVGIEDETEIEGEAEVVSEGVVAGTDIAGGGHEIDDAALVGRDEDAALAGRDEDAALAGKGEDAVPAGREAEEEVETGKEEREAAAVAEIVDEAEAQRGGGGGLAAEAWSGNGGEADLRVTIANRAELVPNLSLRVRGRTKK